MPKPKSTAQKKSLGGENSKAENVIQEVRELSDPKAVEILSRFFKTGKGQYGEGDLFLGVKVPPLRKISKSYKGLPLSELQKIVKSKYHEERLLGFFILCEKFQKTPEEDRKELHLFYLKT